jgi:hypothetical protein
MAITTFERGDDYSLTS